MCIAFIITLIIFPFSLIFSEIWTLSTGSGGDLLEPGPSVGYLVLWAVAWPGRRLCWSCCWWGCDWRGCWPVYADSAASPLASTLLSCLRTTPANKIRGGSNQTLKMLRHVLLATRHMSIEVLNRTCAPFLMNSKALSLTCILASGKSILAANLSLAKTSG